MRPFATVFLIVMFGFTAHPIAAQERVVDTVDLLTGEPVPFGFEAPPSQAAPRGGDELVPSQYLAAGASKLVRSLDTDTGGFVYQDGAYLVLADGAADEDNARIDTLLLPAQPSDMVVEGNLGYLPLRKSQGLLVVDLTTFEAVGQAEGRDLLSIAVRGNFAYAGRGTSGLVVYDVSDPANPTEVAIQGSAGSSNGTYVDGTTLYVAAGTSGLQVFDLTDPAAPDFVTNYGTDDVFCTYVTVRDGVAYLTGGFGLIALDVTDPSMPTEIGTFPTGGETTYEIAFDGATAYLPGLDGLRQLDTSNLEAITQEAIVSGSQFLTVDVGLNEGVPVVFSAERFQGAYALEADGLGESLYLENAGFTNKLFFDGDLLYATDLAGQLRVIDTSGDEAEEVGRIDVPPNTQGLFVADGYAYVTDADFGGTGFTVVDVSDPTAPAIVGSYGEGNQAFGVDVVGTTAYVAFGFSGIVVLDVSDPADPQNIGSYFFGANAFDVDVRDDIAYVASFGGGMLTLDVSDPADIQLLDQETSWGFLNAVDLGPEIDEIAFIADGAQGLRVVDISNPAALTTTSTSPTLSQARDVVGARFELVDLAFPVAYVADDFFGLREFIGADETGSFESTDRGIGVTIKEATLPETEATVALAAGETGIYLFTRNQFEVASEDGASAEPFTLESAYPNPLRATTTLRYSLPDAADVTLAVYDVLGRCVATLADGRKAAGPHTATFDATGLSSGVYIARFAVGAQSQTQKLLVVR